MPTVVITGASSGIGKAIAVRLAENGWTVFAGIRDENDGEKLRQEHASIRPIILDVTKADDIETSVATVEDHLGGATLDGLINNAGIAQMGPLTVQPMEEIRAHFEVNVLGAVAMCQAFAPALGQDTDRRGKAGRIVNITSLGGEIASPFLGAYTATKHAMESVTDTLRRELGMFGIDAIAVGPGAVKTPIWQKARKDGGHGYQDTPWAKPLDRFIEDMSDAGRTGLEVEYIAEVVEKALTDEKPDARYAPVPNKLTNYYLLRAMPKRWADAIFRKRLGMERQS